MLPSVMWPHISIEEVNSLNENEADMLLFICNVWAKISPPVSVEDDPYPINLNVIRYAKRQSILDRVKQAESIIKDESRSIYEALCNKLSIPIEKKVDVISEPVKMNSTGSL